MQDRGHDTVDANELLGFAPDLRDYGVGAHILTDLGVRSLRLMTNNPAKYAGLRSYGLEIVERLPLVIRPTPHNAAYLDAKRRRLGHLLDEPSTVPVTAAPGVTPEEERADGAAVHTEAPQAEAAR